MKLRYFFDPGAGICLWAADDEARGQFGDPVELEKLALSRLILSFDGSTNGRTQPARRLSLKNNGLNS